jgi:hypothetical protein
MKNKCGENSKFIRRSLPAAGGADLRLYRVLAMSIPHLAGKSRNSRLEFGIWKCWVIFYMKGWCSHALTQSQKLKAKNL